MYDEFDGFISAQSRLLALKGHCPIGDHRKAVCRAKTSIAKDEIRKFAYAVLMKQREINTAEATDDLSPDELGDIGLEDALPVIE